MKFLQILTVLGIAAIVASSQVKAQVVEIGTGTATNISLPMEPYYGYSYSQSLFLQSELNLSNKRISKIAYNYNGTGAFTDQIAIYIGHTDLQKLTMWYPASQMTKVYEGNYALSATAGWYEVVLSTPFVYNNTQNLVIAFDENTAGYHSSSNDFYCTAVNDTMSISYYRDASDVDPFNPPTTPLGTGANPASSTVNRLKYRPNIRITFEDIPTGPNIVVSPSSINFGIVEAGVGTSTKYVTFSNTGISTLNITDVSGISSPFSMNLTTSIVLAPGAQSSPTAIVFAPVAAGSFDQTINIVSDATSGNSSIQLHGEAYPQGIIYESFEGVFPPNGWEATPAAQWTQGTAPYDGAKNAYLANGKAGILSTPKLNINDNDSLVFYARKSSSSTTAQLLVKYSPDKNSWTELMNVPLTATYTRYVVYLSSAAGLNYIGFDGVGVTYLDYVRGPLIYISTTPPEPATNPVPADSAVDILLSTNLSWQGLINATGYKISIGTDNPPTNMVNGLDLGNVTTYALSGLNYSTQYFWKVIPYNQYGDCPNPTVWSFTTMSDPLITSFPYFQGFENNNGLVPPLGWTGNLWSRGTESNSGLYCARVSYSHTGAAILQTPYINLPANSRIKFFWKDDDISTAKGILKRNNDKVAEHDTTFFEISVNKGVTWTTLATLAEPAQATTYKQEIVSLASYAGDSVLLRWRDITDATYNAWGTGLDDITIEVVQPNPVASINLTEWNAGNTVIGSTANSGNIFTLTNDGMGILTISQFTDLSATDFSTTLTTAVSLAAGESASFGFSYNPSNLGSDNVAFVIETNGGNVTVNLSGNGINPVAWSFEGFEGETFPPDGWTLIDNDNDSYNWFVINNATYAHTGNKCAGSDSWYNNIALTPDNFLVSPQFTVSADAGILKWWVAGQDPDYVADHYGIFISTTGNSAADFTTSLYEETISSDVWAEHTVDLSAYMGQQVYIAFRHYNCTDMYIMKIDDVELLPAQNFAPEFTSTPITSAILNEEYIYNVSATDANGDALVFGATVLPEWLTLTDNGDGTAQLHGTPTSNGIFNVTLTVNDGTVTVEQSFAINVTSTWTFEGFEGATFPPAGWTLIDSDGDSFNWEELNNPNHAHTGSKCAISWSYIDNPLTPDNYLVTPQFLVTEQTITLKWWAAPRGQTYIADKYGVYLSISGNTASDFTIQLYEETFSTTGWREQTVDLSEYLGQHVYIAFRHYDCTDMYGVKIDDVELLPIENHAPVFESSPILVAYVDSVYTYNIIATDADGDELEFGALQLPPWAILTDNGDGTAVFYGTPTQEGAANVVLTVTDGQVVTQQAFTIDVRIVSVNNLNKTMVSIYPNPANTFIRIAGISSANVVIYNAIGKVVASYNNVSSETAIDINNLPEGAYFVNVNDSHNVRVMRFNISR